MNEPDPDAGVTGNGATDAPPVTVLLADDNDDSREIYGTLLTHEGYRVLEARDGKEAVRLSLAESPDLLLLNLLMPEIDGLGVLERLRSEPKTEDLPCVCLTGDARMERMGQAMMRGADAFLTKPAEPRDVLKTIRAMLDREPDTTA